MKKTTDNLEGYTFNGWVVDNIENTSIVTPTKDINAYAKYNVQKFTMPSQNNVTIKKGDDVVNDKSINYGSSIVITANKVEGKHLTSFKVDDTSIVSGTTPDDASYTISKVMRVPTISTSYELDVYKLKIPSTFSNGKMEYSSDKVTWNSSVDVTFTPNNNYYLSKVVCGSNLATLTDDNKPLTTSGKQTKTLKADKDLTHDSSITVTPTFSKFVYKLETKVNETSQGSIKITEKDKSTDVTELTCGTTYKVTASPKTGYHIDTYSFNGGESTSAKTDTFTPTLTYSDGQPTNLTSGETTYNVTANFAVNEYKDVKFQAICTDESNKAYEWTYDDSLAHFTEINATNIKGLDTLSNYKDSSNNALDADNYKWDGNWDKLIEGEGPYKKNVTYKTFTVTLKAKASDSEIYTMNVDAKYKTNVNDIDKVNTLSGYKNGSNGLNINKYQWETGSEWSGEVKSGNVVFMRQLEVRKYNVTINPITGGTVSASQTSVEYGNTTTITAIPNTTEGYYISKYPNVTISGHTQKSALNSWTPTITADKTITSSDITFDNTYDVKTSGTFAHGSVTVDANKKSVAYNTESKITINATETGYYIKSYGGNNTNSHELTEVIWEPTITDDMTIKTKDIVFDNKYDVSFVVVGQKGAGEDVSDDKRTVDYNTSLGENMPTNPTAIEGYTFVGWNTKDDGSGDGFDGTTTITSDNVVYAKYEEWGLKFNDDDKTVIRNAEKNFAVFTVEATTFNTYFYDATTNSYNLDNILLQIQGFGDNCIKKDDTYTYTGDTGRVTVAVMVNKDKVGELTTANFISKVCSHTWNF